MFVWRLTKRRNADLSGRGGEIVDGRWHSKGRPVVYCAGTASLAVLEVRVHLDLSVTPTDYVLMQIRVPDDVPRSVVKATDLPPAWRTDQHLTRSIGDAWLQQCPTALMVVPSVIVDYEHNLLLNPRHADASLITTSRITSFTWDDRLLGSPAS